MLSRIFLILISIIFAFVGFSQVENDLGVEETIDASGSVYDDTKLLYRSQITGGALVHTQGWGLFLRKTKHLTALKKQIWSAEFAVMKHPKERKSFNIHDDNSKGFIYGKLNALAILRPSFGRQRILFEKEAKSSVQISYLIMGGASLGLVKPVYLLIDYDGTNSNRTPVTEKYDPEKHTLDKIYGRAPTMKGIEGTVIHPGLHAKFALNFEYSAKDDLVKAIETGITFDAFYKEIPMMAFIDNQQFFFTYYLSFEFGKKSFN
ncbi:MAG: hypothetical protein COA57_00265 [Flavobacteriales bacterium]|nr:MAG: hypothetical protein COA57_00265 [Flavobacteriales bacterium]